MVENLPANAGYIGSIPGSRRFPWRRKRQPTPVFWPGRCYGPRNLAGPWCLKESDTIEQLNNNVLGGNFSNEDRLHLRIQTRITFYFKK